ncbi:helix-turn-helix domain-containing protein [Okeania sp. SIO2C2]|uniref:helix-turn-helix domain-containing protein n=1 Tax=Okeania sp. SIO2C2 TaxID=2607787 RepID=UPI00338EF0AC
MRERAEIVRLNHHGWSVAAIAKYKNKSPHTVRNSLHRWSSQGFEGLWEKIGRGRKAKWVEEDIKHIEICLEKDERTYNAAQLSRKLSPERGVTLSSDRFRKVLKKRGGVGKGQDLNNLPPQMLNKNKPKKLTHEWLLWSHSAGEICLKFRKGIRFLSLESRQLQLCSLWTAKTPQTDKKTGEKVKYSRSLCHRS